MTATAVSLADRLAAWLESEGIATGDLATEVAASLLEHESMVSAAHGIGNDGRRLDLLRFAALSFTDIASRRPEEFRGRRGRMWEAVND